MPNHKTSYVKTPTRKMLGPNGGVGSIIETPKGAMKVEEFDKWRFFDSELGGLPQFAIEDNRLLARLRFHFSKLEKLVRVPENEEHYVIKATPVKPELVASAHYFPEWMYCPRCERFMHLNHWWRRWKMTLEKYKVNRELIKEKFIKPKCYHCYDEMKLKGKKDPRPELEQVRFIMTAPNGDVQDIPWSKWPTIEKNVKEEDSNSGTIRLHERCCLNQDLRYIRSETYADLAGVRIKCATPGCPSKGKEVNLAGLFGMRLGKPKEEQFKPVIRTSNSVYYPLTINSIYLPKKIEQIAEADKQILINTAKAVSREQLYEIFKHRYSREVIDSFLAENKGPVFESENIYRLKEYNFIKENPAYTNEGWLDYEDLPVEQLSNFSIRAFKKFNRLKLTTVQTGYTRQEPLDKDVFLSGGNDGGVVQVRYTSTQGRETSVLLATESFGEGLFLDFDHERLDAWFHTHYTQSRNFKERIEKLSLRVRESEFLPKNKFSDNKHLAKFILLHTLSHLLIKELEFLCGYSAATINERLFVNSGTMQGLLLYTVAGAEGSYGGITSQGSASCFQKILQSALQRSQDCTSDPVCYHSEGQGIGGINLAACYSCALLPETSCEEFNGFLDRALLIDTEFGFLTVSF